MIDDDDHERLLTIDDVADRLGMSRDTVRTMSIDGRLIEPLNLGKLLRWRERDINAWIAARGAAQDAIAAAARKSLAPRKRG